MEELKKWLTSIVLGGIATWCKQYGVLIILVVVAILFDVVTGLVKAKVKGENISSKRFSQGGMKKLMSLVALFFGFFLDCAIPYMCHYIGISIPFNMPFSMIICFYIVINEAISVCENIYETDSNIVPKWIVNILKLAKDKIEETGNDKDSVGK